MGLYNDRLADLSEARSTQRVAQRLPSRGLAAKSRRSMGVQSLLFRRDAGWSSSKAKAWAQSHGYRYGKVDVTDQYVRIRQSDPSGTKVKRTIPFGRGIRAVVAREGNNNTMAVAKEASRKKKKSSPARKRRRKAAKRSAPVRRHRRKTRVEAARRRRPRRRRARETGYVMEAKRRRRSRRRVSEAWRGDSAGHAKSARKGWRRRKASKAKSAPRRRRRRRARETTYEASPRRRRSSHMMEASRPRRRHRRHRRARMFESRGGRSSGLSAGQFAAAMISGGLGFVIADGLDRFLATYNPAGTERPKDKFTSDGAGTLANTLNVAARPDWMRLGAGLVITAVPAVGSAYVKNPMVKSSLEGAAIGAGVSLFKTLWNNLLMPLLIPKDTSVASLQKSYIARLYPAEVAAAINMKQQPAQTVVASAGSGALSGASETGVGAQADVGPFALSGDSPYPTAAQALRDAAGLHDYPSVQNAWGTGGDSPYPTAAQALRQEAGMGAPAGHGNPGQPGVSAAWEPGPPSSPGPGPQAAPHSDPSCGCIGDENPYLGFVGDAQEEPLFMK